jgi:DNA polymerase elongation subunit (family B)
MPNKALKTAFKRYKEHMKKLNEKEQEIVDKYIELANKLGHHPVRQDLIDAGISYSRVKHYFGNYPKLTAYVIKNCPISVPLEKPVSSPRVLLFDIETSHIKAKLWRPGQQYVGHKQIIEDWSILAWAAKWLDEDDIMYKDLRRAKNKKDDKNLIKDIWRLLDEADVVITQNGKSFDAPKLNARFEKHDMGAPSSYRHMDTKRMAQKHFDLSSYSLDFMCKYFNLPVKKSSHKKFPGDELWDECMANNQEAWTEMEHYNKLDVLSLEALYKRINKWDVGVNFSVFSGETTCQCGSKEFIKLKKPYTTNSGKYNRYKCKSCGAEMRDTKNLLKSGQVKVGTNR